ncbi:ankyrin repeat domain-containing protein [Candidatus Mesenet endosymbiont of Phosphuga atrata]|uniref:ankyrin repeat domain-containing protein n=1 Tax=Candidatus Mesenet endosymbiont of Phosphuga atrata TaxID=3066221 RepID=UPI0030D44BC8
MLLEEQLVDAVEGNNIEKVRSLLEKGANPNIGVIDPIAGNRTIMCIAAEEGNIEIMKLLLKHGADIDNGEKGTKGQNFTPLNAAVILNQEEAAIFLVKNGANIHYDDQNGSTPLHNAIYQQSRKLVELFLNIGANIHARNVSEETPLHVATHYYTDPQIIRLLLEYGSSVNNTGHSGYTPLRNYMKNYDLYSAITSKRPLESFFLLLLFGANVNKECRDTRERINYTPRLKNCLTAFKQIKAMPHLGKLIEANIKRDKKENVRVIASYINNKAEGQELIEEFEVIKEKYGFNGELSFIPGCLLYVIKNMIFTFLKFYDREKSIITDFGSSINADTVTKEGTNVQRYLPEEVLKEIFSYLDSNEQKNVMLALSEKADVLLSKLQDTCQTPDTLLAKAYVFLGKLKNIYQTSTDKGCCIS